MYATEPTLLFFAFRVTHYDKITLFFRKNNQVVAEVK